MLGELIARALETGETQTLSPEETERAIDAFIDDVIEPVRQCRQQRLSAGELENLRFP